MTGPAAARTPEGGYIGAPIPRREDARLLTGRGTFVDDLEMPGVAHAAMVRSPHAHARVRGIDTAAALALPGVLAVVSAADVADIQKPWPARMPSPVPGTTVRHGVRHARHLEVVDEGAAPGEQARVLPPRDRGADVAAFGRADSWAHAVATSASTASTMPW